MTHSPFHAVGRPTLLVVGDLILDQYTWGNAERVSPEAPVIVLTADEAECRLGGAASVASLLRAMEAQVVLAGVTGSDQDACTLRRLLAEQSIGDELVLAEETRPTTVKQRFIGRAANRRAHQMLRVDRETRTPLPAGLTHQLCDHIVRRLEQFHAVLISDYGKGTCSPELLHTLIGACRKRGIPVLIDPARIATCSQRNGYSRYDGASLLLPNRVEAELITGVSIGSQEDARDAAQQLLQICQVESVVIKLDSEGMLLVNRQGHCEAFGTRECAVHDVTGAGDTVLAVLGLFQAAGICLADAIPIANAAAGVQVQHIGVASITRSDIEVALCACHTGPTTKLITLERASELAAYYQQQGRTIVFTNGCFDLLHIGHVTHLQEAARLGDVLFVAVNSDSSVRRLKGPSRPIINEHARAHMLASLGCVDHVLVFREDTPQAVLQRLRPDVLAKGATTPVIDGSEYVTGYGGSVRHTETRVSTSTTSLLSSIKDMLCT